MSNLPAILIGGPPHSGKSVLAYSLSQALRTENIPHYLLRAYPDGEGDWSNEADPILVNNLRVKGTGDAHWVAAICHDIDHRQLSLLVDVGGNPTPAQESIFSHCTHSIILAPTATDLAKWRTIAAQHKLIPLAELHSVLHGKQIHQSTLPILRGTISGLERGTLAAATGTLFNPLMTILQSLLKPHAADLRNEHLAAAPAETVIDIERLCRTLTGGNRWQPHHLPRLLNYLPKATPIALYGRAPGWIIAALAYHALPAQFFQFDPRFGWLTPPALIFDTPPVDAPLQTKVSAAPHAWHLKFLIHTDYLPLPKKPPVIPPVPSNTGIIIEGKIPHWLIAALARQYAPAPWLAIFQPQLKGAVVISTTKNSHKLGDVIAS